VQLAAKSGRVAMVTQQSWMFMPAFAGIRGLPEARGGKLAFAGLLRASTIEVLAHLGPRAFDEIGGEIVNSALFVTAMLEPTQAHGVTALRLIGPVGASEKESLLRKAVSGETNGVLFKPHQSHFLTIPGHAICYWLRPRFVEILSSAERVGAHCTLTDGVSAADKFVRFLWEVPNNQERWPTYQKGGGYRKWFGFNIFTCDWHAGGAKVRQHILERYPAEKFSLKYKPFERSRTWVTWSDVASGSMGARLGSSGDILGSKGPGVTSDEITHQQLLALLNSRAFTYVLRSTSTTLQFSYPSVRDAPGLWIPHGQIVGLVDDAIAEKQVLISDDTRESTFYPYRPRGYLSLDNWFWAWREDRLARTARLLSVEAILERIAFTRMGLTDVETEDVIRDTGRPAGWLPLLVGYDAVPASAEVRSLGPNLTEALADVERRVCSPAILGEMKDRLNDLYQAGPGGEIETPEDPGVDDDEVQEGELAESGARIPIPAETFLEELSQRLEIHPISIYWLLRELRDKERVVSKSELISFVEDYLTVLVLRLFGHQWPRELEGREPLAARVDKDGIITITEGTGESTLIAHLRACLASDFGEQRAGAIEREFQDITGRPLGAWLASDFFKRHISQFRKRPIAWQVTSSSVTTKRRGQVAAQGGPAFSCLIYYHRLDADLLPKLRTHYIGPLRINLQTELGGLEKIRGRSADQDARRLELEGKLEELKAFDARLDEVLGQGFSSPALEKIAAKDPLDKWTARDGRARPPQTREVLFSQERRYHPDLNDGVRVNIAPLQRAGLLAVDVLAAKDVERAISDRAEWRADERRWCREGKLPQPGWWTVDTPEMTGDAA
jgi:hypothetical protein